MTHIQPRFFGLGAAVLALALAPGCASKKYVRGTIAPVDTRVGVVETKTQTNTDDIAKLDDKVEADVSRLDERTTTALERAADAQTAADRAQGSADEAAARAADARDFA